MLRKVSLYEIIVFLMIWVYYSLNARYLNMPGFTLLRWLFPIMLIFFVVLGKRGKIALPPNILIFFVLGTVPSILVSADQKTSLLKFISFILILYGSYLFFCSLNSKKLLQRYFECLVFVLVIYQMLNITFMLLGIGVDNGRSAGITTNANTLGIYANLAFWAILYLMGQTRKLVYKGILLALLISAGMAVLASGSRTAFVVLVLNIIVVLMMFFRKSIFIFPTVIVILTGVYLLFNGKLTFLQITALDRLLEDGGMKRDILWNSAISVWRRYQNFGCGYTVSPLFNVIERGMAFHNSYLSFLVECGLWGCCVLGGGIIAYLIRVITHLIHNKSTRTNDVFFVGCLMIFNLLIAAWSESFLFAVGSTEGFTFWFLIAWLAAYMKLDC